MTRIAVIHDSHGGRTTALARALAEGASGTLYRIPPLDAVTPHLGPGAEAADLPVADAGTLAAADGIALGCPVHLGAPSAAMMAYLAQSGRLWLNRDLKGRAASVFVAAGTGGGAEAAIVTLWSVLAAHGLVLVPGAPEVAEGPGGGPLGTIMAGGAEEAALIRAREQGARLAQVSRALAAARQSAAQGSA